MKTWATKDGKSIRPTDLRHIQAIGWTRTIPFIGRQYPYVKIFDHEHELTLPVFLSLFNAFQEATGLFSEDRH